MNNDNDMNDMNDTNDTNDKVQTKESNVKKF